MKKYKFMNLMIFVSLFILFPTNSYADTIDEKEIDNETIDIESDQEETINEQMLDKLTIEEVASFWDQIEQEYGKYIPELREKNIAELIEENGTLSLKSSVKGIVSYLFYELIQNGKLLGTLIILTLFSVVLQTMHTAFEKSVVSKIAYFVVYMVLIYITLNSFYLVFTYAKETIDTMSSF